MSPSEINHAVAQVLGEALEVVQQRGFSLLDHAKNPDFDPRAPAVIDWDASEDNERVVSICELIA